jgi:RNA polymerase sigma-32 factor
MAKKKIITVDRSGRLDEEEDLQQPQDEEFDQKTGTDIVEIDPFQRYMNEINRYSLLDPEEEKRLTSRYHETGDRDTAATLITANLRLVVKIALDFQKYWVKNLLDLVQEGNIGLMQAIKNLILIGALNSLIMPLIGSRRISLSLSWITGNW